MTWQMPTLRAITEDGIIYYSAHSFYINEFIAGRMVFPKQAMGVLEVLEIPRLD